MTYIGVIASAVLHVGGLFLLLTARAPEPLVTMGSDSPVAVDIISVDEYNALVSRAPAKSTLSALRTQPEAPRAPVVTDADPILDTLEERTPIPEAPDAATELVMRLPPAIEDAVPEVEDERPVPEDSTVEVAPPPDPLALDEAALRDKGVDPADLIPSDDVQVAIAPPVPEPPRGVYDAPVIDTDPDEPPKSSETEGEGEEKAEPAPESEPSVEKPVETAEVEDPAPLMTPLPVPKPRGSLAVASNEDRAPSRGAEAKPPVPPKPNPPVAEPTLADRPTPDLQLTEAELEEERRMMAALMEQMRANQPPSEAEMRAAEEEARRKYFEEQQRQAELAALDEAERRKRIEQDRAKAAAEAAARAEAERRERELAEAKARELAALQEREAQQLRAQQEAALQEQRELDEARRRQAEEAQRLAQEQFERRQREEAARQQAERDRAARRQQLATLNTNIAPETRANNVLTGTVPAPAAPQQDSFLGGDRALASILGAAANAAQSANTGPSFGQGNGGGGNRGASLTQGETQAVLNQLRRCWRVDTFSANARSLVVIMRAQIRQNGFVNQATIDLVSPNPIPPDYQIAVDRARTALQDVRCQPFSLPANKYNAWRDIVIRFDPAQMVLQ